MELKSGYKQTEVGVIPEDWKVIEYNHIGQIIDGDRGVHYPSSGELKDTGYCLFLNAGNVTKSGFQFEDCTFITKEKDEKLNKGKLRRYDVVLTTRGTVGNFAYFDESVNHENVRINSGMVILRNTSKNIDTKYQYVVLRSKIVGLQVERMAFGSAQPQLTVKGINLFKIPLPPTTAEQTAIASTLSDADTLIQSLTRLITKKHQIKQGAMQTLLNPYENGRLKEGWMLKKLGDICENITTGKLDANAMIENGEYSFFTCAKQVYRINHFAFDYEALLVSGNGANVGYIHYFKGKFNAYQRTYVLSRFKCDVHYLKVFMERNLQNRIKVEVNAGNTPYIVMGTLTGMDVLLPENKTEQTRIATILSGMDTEIAALEAKLAKYQQIKQGMMQNLLTGKIRLI